MSSLVTVEAVDRRLEDCPSELNSFPANQLPTIDSTSRAGTLVGPFLEAATKPFKHLPPRR